MKRASVAPDRTTLLRPLPARHTVVIPCDKTHDIVSNHLILVRIDIVDLADVNPDGSIDRLPARHWMCADHGVNWGEGVSDVERRAARRHDLVATSCRSGFKHGLCAGCREGLEVSPHRGGYAIVAVYVRERTNYVFVVLRIENVAM